MSGGTRVFLPAAPGARGRDEVRGHALAHCDGGERVLVPARDDDVVHGDVEVLPLYVLEERRLTAGADTALAIVDVIGDAPAMALRAPVARDADAVGWVHSSLAVDDLDTALAFFRDAFGFRVRFQERGMSDQIRGMTGLDSVTCDLAQLETPISPHVLELIAFHDVPAGRAGWAPTAPGMAHVAFSVDDLERALAAVVRAGGHVLGEITEFEPGPAAYCQAPGGVFLEIAQ